MKRVFEDFGSGSICDLVSDSSVVASFGCVSASDDAATGSSDLPSSVSCVAVVSSGTGSTTFLVFFFFDGAFSFFFFFF